MWIFDLDYFFLKIFVYKYGGFVKIVGFWGGFIGGGVIFLKVECKRWCLMFIILEKWGLLRESLIEYYIYVFFLFVYCMEIVLIILVKVRKNIY